MKTKIIVFLATAFAASWITQAICASIIEANSLVLTENSPTSLTATYNGSTSGVTVVLDGPDAWAVEVSSAAFETFGTNWVEPENSLQVNTVFVSLFDSPFVSVVSDTTGTGAVFPNGTDVVGGVDLNNNLPIDITFFDNAATAEGHTAPDTGSTFGLLSLALAALFGATRFRLA